MYYLSSFSVVFVALFSLMAAPAPAQELVEGNAPENPPVFSQYERDLAATNPEYFTLSTDSIRVTLLEVTEEPAINYVELQELPPKDLDAAVVAIERIVNIASKIWQIVKDNAPAANINTKYATAYPEGVTIASQLAQWSKPRSYTYGFYAENLYGAVMVDCKYKFSFAYNGSYKGKGKYLTGVAVTPTVAKVGWGYTLGMSASVPDSTVVNVGADSDPVAAMQMKLRWKISTVLKEINGTSVYYVQGDGYFDEIASPWPKRERERKLEDIKAAAPLFTPEKIF